MSSLPTNPRDKRVDPLIDAYQQASELEAQAPGAQPGAALRAAVLAHARVVAQSANAAEPDPAVSEAVRATPAANESKPVWRMVAGVVLGLAGMWVYQLTRPATTDEANIAVMTAPQSASANTKAKATESTVVASAPVVPVPSVAAGAPAAAAPTISASAAAPAQRETAIAVATPSKTVTTARDTSARERASADGNSAVASAPRDSVADAARNDTSVALAKMDPPAKRAEQTAVAAASVAPAAAPAATSAIPEVATSEPLAETAVASAEMRKAVRPSAAARAPVASAPAAAVASPNAFPATASGAMAAAAPPPAAPASPAASPQSAAAGGSAAMRQGVVSTLDAAMFSAIRAGNVNALRAALARGANVNVRDEAGRSALQIARERSDADMVRTLELAGAK